MIPVPAPNIAGMILFDLFLIGLMAWGLYMLFFRSIELAASDLKRRLAQNHARQSCFLGLKKVQWIKEHQNEIARDPVNLLNHPELLDMVEKDQRLYEKICSLDPEYSNIAAPPKELHRELIRLAESLTPKP